MSFLSQLPEHQDLPFRKYNKNFPKLLSHSPCPGSTSLPQPRPPLPCSHSPSSPLAHLQEALSRHFHSQPIFAVVIYLFFDPHPHWTSISQGPSCWLRTTLNFIRAGQVLYQLSHIPSPAFTASHGDPGTLVPFSQPPSSRPSFHLLAPGFSCSHPLSLGSEVEAPSSTCRASHPPACVLQVTVAAALCNLRFDKGQCLPHRIVVPHQPLLRRFLPCQTPGSVAAAVTLPQLQECSHHHLVGLGIT